MDDNAHGNCNISVRASHIVKCKSTKDAYQTHELVPRPSHIYIKWNSSQKHTHLLFRPCYPATAPLGVSDKFPPLAFPFPRCGATRRHKCRWQISFPFPCIHNIQSQLSKEISLVYSRSVDGDHDIHSYHRGAEQKRGIPTSGPQPEPGAGEVPHYRRAIAKPCQ